MPVSFICIAITVIIIAEAAAVIRDAYSSTLFSFFFSTLKRGFSPLRLAKYAAMSQQTKASMKPKRYGK